MSGNSNQSLLAKADLALSDLISAGGFLPAEQAQTFLKLLIKEAVLMKMCKVVPMKSFKKKIDKIKFGSRIMRAGSEATALPSGDRSKPSLSQVELDVKLFKAQVNLSDETLEDNIEEGDFKSTVLSLMAERLSVDFDEMMIQGDESSADPFLAQFDGILASATSNTVNAGGVALDKNVLRDCLKAMPQEYLRRKKDMRFLTSIDAELDYRDSLSDRMTDLGDESVTEDRAVKYSNIPVIPVPMMPENLGGGSNTTNVIFVDPKNIALGIWRQIRFEWDKDIEAGVTKIVATLRADMKYTEETAVVKATNILVA